MQGIISCESLLPQAICKIVQKCETLCNIVLLWAICGRSGHWGWHGISWDRVNLGTEISPPRKPKSRHIDVPKTPNALKVQCVQKCSMNCLHLYIIVQFCEVCALLQVLTIATFAAVQTNLLEQRTSRIGSSISARPWFTSQPDQT